MELLFFNKYHGQSGERNIASWYHCYKNIMDSLCNDYVHGDGYVMFMWWFMIMWW